MCYNKAMKKRALSLVGAVIVSLAGASSAVAEGLPVIGATGGTSSFFANEGNSDLMRFDLSVTSDEQSLIEEYCTPDSSVREVDYVDPTSSTTHDGLDDYVYVDIGPSGPQVYVHVMWIAPTLPEGEVRELQPQVLLTCTRMTSDNLPNGFVQVKIIAPTVFGYTPTYADLEPVDEASWTADLRQYQGDRSCLTDGASLVEVRSASLMFGNGRYYNPVTVVRNLGNNNAPVVELAIDDAMRDSGPFEVRVICVTTATAYEYNTTADLSNTGTGPIAGTLEVNTEGSKGQLVLSPCPANAEVTLADASDAAATVEFSDPVQSGDEVSVLFGVEFSDPDSSSIERTFKMSCYVDGPPRVIVTGSGRGVFTPSSSGNNAQTGITPDTVAAAPVVGTVTVSPSPIVLGSEVTVTPNAPCPAGTDIATWFPADIEALEDDLNSGAIVFEQLVSGPETGPSIEGAGSWKWNFPTSAGALTGLDTYELELYYVCAALSPESVTARYEAVTLRFVEPGGEVTTQDGELDGEATGSDNPAPNPSSDPTPRFEVVPAPAPSSSGGSVSSADSGDDKAETTGDDSVADVVRAFDFDIERQAIVDTATGAAVGVFDPETGNFVSPDDGSLIAVTDPSNGQVTVLATGDVVARILGSSTDEASDGDDDGNDGDGSSSNTLAYVLIGAAGVLLLLLGAFWLGNRGRARATAPPTMTPSSAAPSPVPPQEPAVPSAPEPTSPLPPPPPPATPDVSPPSDPDATPPGGTPTT
jgi:hypothetical protein